MVIKLSTGLISFIKTVIFLICIYLVFKFFLLLIQKRLLKKAKTKKKITNIKILTRIIKYVFIFLLFLFAIFQFSGSLTGFGLSLGFLSAALGFALQRPLTGLIAWIVIIIKRPFEIGDRVIIGNIRGDILDFSLTHIYISEIGGTVSNSEENSGRIVMIPNSIMFEKDIINYTSQTESVLDEAKFTITFKSNIDKALKIALKVANIHTKKFNKEKRAYARTFIGKDGMIISLRYFVPAKIRQEISSKISYNLFKEISKQRDIEFAYPHREIIVRKEQNF